MRVRGSADALRACMDAYEWKKKKRKENLLTGLPRICRQRHGHADDRVGVWTRMCCVRMRMSIKEKEEGKKAYFVGADGGRVALRTCCVWTRMVVDADGGGRGWWWIPRWRVDADVLHADADKYKGKRRKKKLTLLVRMVDAWPCGRVRVDADGGGCGWMVVDADGGGRGWWWMRMVTDRSG